MRSVLALGLLIMLCASADAATVHHFHQSKPHIPWSEPVTVVPKRFAVPGWTDEETEKWLYNGSAGSGLG
jgi:hypothetical protein